MPPFLCDTGSQSFTDLIDSNASMKMKETNKNYPAPFFPKSILRSRVTPIRDSFVHPCHQYRRTKPAVSGTARLVAATVRLESQFSSSAVHGSMRPCVSKRTLRTESSLIAPASLPKDSRRKVSRDAICSSFKPPNEGMGLSVSL